MSVENVLKEKISKLSTTQQVGGRVSAADLTNFYQDNSELAKSFGKEVLNLEQVLSEKIQFLMAGKPLIIENTDFAKLKDFIEEIEIQESYFILLGILFKKFTGHIVIEKIDDKVNLRIADPKFPNVVYRIGKMPYKAEIWTAFKFERTQYWKQTIYTSKTIKNVLFNDKDGSFESRKQVDIDKFNKEIDEDLQIKADTANDYGFIPVEQVQWLPSYDYSTSSLNNISPSKRLEPLQEMLNEATKALRRELYLNRTKLIVDQTLLDKNQAKQIADESIIAVLKDTGDYEDKNKVFEIIQGDPKVEQYWTNIGKIITLAVQSLKLSEIQEGGEGGGPATATEAIFNRGNDVETSNSLSIFHQRTLTRILAKAKAIYDGTTQKESELNLKPWSVQIIPNVIMNEAKLTEIVIQQLGAGLINMVQAKVKLEGISQSDAEESLSQEEQFHNPTLSVSTAFNEEGKEDIKNNNGKDVTEGK